MEILNGLASALAKAARFLVFVLTAALCAQTGSPRVLEPGKVLRDSADSKQARSYVVSLKPGQFLYVELRSIDADTIVILHSPNGEALIEAGTADFPKKTIPIFWVAEVPGNHLLEVRPSASPSRYEIKPKKLHPAGVQERKRAEAERLFSQAAAETGKYDFKGAVERYARASVLFRETKTPAGLEAALHHLALSYNDSDDEDRALLAYQQALKVARQLKDLRGQGRILANVGVAYANLDQQEMAISYYQQSAKLFHSSGDRQRELAISVNLAICYERLGRYDEAIGYYARALSAAREQRNRFLEAHSLAGLGWNHFSLGNYDKAVDYDEQALPVLREVKDRKTEGMTLHNLGIVYHETSRFDDALHYYQEALQILREVKDRRGEAAVLANIGRLNEDLGQFDRAVAFLEQTLSVQREIKDRGREAVTLTDLAGAYRDLNDYQKALQSDEQALSILGEINDRGFQVITLKDIGLTYASLGQQRKAIGYYNQALALERDVKGSNNDAEILNALGEANRSLPDSAKAISYHTQALAASRVTKDLGEESLALTGLMNAWNDMGQRRLATFYGKQSVNALQSLRSSIRGLDQDLQKSFLKKNEKPYHALAELLIAEGRLGEAEQVLGLLKRDEYFEYIRRDAGERASLSGRADFTPEEVDWEQRYREIGGRLMAIGAERGELITKKTLTSAETRYLQQIEEDLKAGNIAFDKFLGDLTQHFSAKPEVNAKVVEELREEEGFMADLRELPAGTVAIYTLAGDDKFHAILRTPDAQKAYEYPIKAVDLNRKVFEFREAVQDPRRDPRPLAAQLYEILIAPMAEDLQQAKAQTLMWSLDGVLRYLPLAALYDGRQYLIEQYRISVMTLASNTRLKDRPSEEWSLAGFGVTKGHGDAEPLPDVAYELAGINAILPGEVRLDEQFTESSMRETLFKRHPVVHIASHFRFQPGDESKSFLLLGDGAHLSLAELKTLPNLFGGVQLLTLSACNTALGDGTEVEGFGTLAQRQGAKAVVASLWPVADNSTSLMMREFYRIRESTPGITKLEALREAQLELLRGVAKFESNQSRRGDLYSIEGDKVLPLFKGEAGPSPYAHPYYWAPFFLMGNWL
jgi:CHAT domain-containing protein/Tfp pilus assembly protein PilF